VHPAGAWQQIVASVERRQRRVEPPLMRTSQAWRHEPIHISRVASNV